MLTPAVWATKLKNFVIKQYLRVKLFNQFSNLNRIVKSFKLANSFRTEFQTDHSVESKIDSIVTNLGRRRNCDNSANGVLILEIINQGNNSKGCL